LKARFYLYGSFFIDKFPGLEYLQFAGQAGGCPTRLSETHDPPTLKQALRASAIGAALLSRKLSDSHAPFLGGLLLISRKLSVEELKEME
jgi:hypothetical protein